MPGPVPLEKQWTLWPRIARPFACRTCGNQYEPTFDPEIDDRNPSTWAWVDHPDGSCSGRKLREPRYRYCRNPNCERFYDYREEARRLRMGKSTRGLLAVRTQPMRRKWLRMPEAANDGP